MAVWLGTLGVVLVLQHSAGAYENDFGGHPDEGAHFVTGLMVRDYLVSGIPQHPMRYAETYYDHYPKVALGHYPPGFYALEGLWLAVFPVNRTSVLLFMAVLTASWGALIFGWARGQLGSLLAVVLAGFTVCLPLTQSLTSVVMSDSLVAIFVLLAAMSFVRFVEKERWWDSLAFGLFAAAATMTKGSGLFLAMLPPMVIVLTGRLPLLKKWSLWLAPIPVIVICGPWLYFSSGITAEGMVDRTVTEHLAMAIPYFAQQFVRTFGFAVMVPVILGVLAILVRSQLRVSPFWAANLSLPLALVAFYSLIPAGLEPRYLLPVVPILLVIGIAGLKWIFTQLPEPRRLQGAWVAGVLLSVLFFWETFEVPQKQFAGFSASAERLLRDVAADSEGRKFLISSDARGEGAFVSAIAMRDQNRPSHVVARSSKVLSKSDWLGRGYEEAFATNEELLTFLESENFDGILVDQTIPEIFLEPHHRRIAEALSASDRFRPLEPKDPKQASSHDRGQHHTVYVPVASDP